MFARTRLARYALLVLLGAAALAPARPDEAKPIPPAPPPAVPKGVTAFASVNVAQVWDHQSFAAVRVGRGSLEFAWATQALVGVTPAELDRLTVFRHASVPDAPLVVVTGRKPLDPAAVVKMLTRPGATAPEAPPGGKVLVAPGAEFAHVLPVDARTLLLAPPSAPAETLQKLAALVPELTAAAGRHALIVSLDVPALAGLPLPVGGPLLEATTATLTADLAADSAAVRLTAAYPTAEKARAAAPLLQAKLTELAGWAKERQRKAEARAAETTGYPAPLLEWVATTAKATTVRADGGAVVATATVKPDEVVSAVLAAVPESAFAPRGNLASSNNLKQIALATHSYQDANGQCPANSYDKDGKPLLSWRVHILPYIEQSALYNKFKLDEPWDSPANKPLSQAVVRIYQVPGRPAALPWETYYQTFIGPKGVKEHRPWHVEGSSKGPKIQEISDGSSNTIMVVEAGTAVPWAKPADLPYDGVLPLPKLGGPGGTFGAAFGDGSVRTFRRGQVPEATMRNLISIADGNVVNIPD